MQINQSEFNKESKYEKFYVPNDFYWGLGIENELYLMRETPIIKNGLYIKKNRRRERYSVDYNTSYDTNKIATYLDSIFIDNDTYNIPQYVNAHTFTKTDCAGEHQTLYVVGKKNNPKFNGKSIHELLKEADPMFADHYGHNYIFDGDTIEFITQNFYKTTVDNCVEELVSYKAMFLEKLNSLTVGLPKLIFPQVNYGLIQFKTNPNNINIFNNGTYHINLTIPTQLDSNGNIQDIQLFEKQHSNAIKLLQWIEPLIILLYGSPDVFSYNDNAMYASGSLRLVASRYIGIGTYNANLMKKGKLLNDLKSTMFMHLYEKSWYNQIYQKTDYISNEFMGYDFNYAKHYNAGIEFRILDYFPEAALPGIINFIILILDHSLENDIKLSAYECDEWHDFTQDVLINGYTVKIPDKFAQVLNNFTNFPLINESNAITYIKLLIEYLHTTYSNNITSSHMSPNMIKPCLHNINQYMWENNYLQYIPTNNKNHIRVTQLYEIYQSISTPTQFNADIVDADLFDAKLFNADLFDAKLFGAKLFNAKLFNTNANDNANAKLIDANSFNAKLFNLLVNTGLHKINGLDLTSFYEKLIAINHIDIGLYLLR